MICTLPDLKEMMKRAKIEMCERVCPDHRVHIVKDGKVRDDLRIEVPWPPAPEPLPVAIA
jgi:hypothetical protein